MPDQQKLLERIALQEFLRVLAISPYVADGPEPPDFSLSLDGSRIGLELIGYVRGQGPAGSSLRQEEEFHARVVQQARRLYLDSGAPPVCVRIRWHHQRPTISLNQLASRIAEVVREACPAFPAQGQVAQAHVTWQGLPAELQPSIQRITVDRWTRGHTHWTTPQSGFIGATRDEIATCVLMKNSKLKRYRSSWDEAWLLIHTTDFYLSGTMDLLPEATQAEYDTGFDRVFVLESVGQVTELKLRNKSHRATAPDA